MVLGRFNGVTASIVLCFAFWSSNCSTITTTSIDADFHQLTNETSVTLAVDHTTTHPLASSSHSSPSPSPPPRPSSPAEEGAPPSLSPSHLPGRGGARGLSLAVAGVIGVCSVMVTVFLCLYGVFYCYTSRHRVSDLDAVEYCIQEEYEAKINFDALERLEPSIRAGIDMDILAKLTNTDPALLDKYRVEDSDIPVVCSPSVISQESLHRNLSITVQDQLQRSSIDSTSSRGLRRVNNTTTPTRAATSAASTISAAAAALAHGSFHAATLAHGNLQGLSRSASNITMLSTRNSKDSQGITYLVEKKAGHLDLLQVLSLSGNSRPRSVCSDLSDSGVVGEWRGKEEEEEEGGEGGMEAEEGKEEIEAEEREREQAAADEEVALWEALREERARMVVWQRSRLETTV